MRDIYYKDAIFADICGNVSQRNSRMPNTLLNPMNSTGKIKFAVVALACSLLLSIIPLRLPAQRGYEVHLGNHSFVPPANMGQLQKERKLRGGENTLSNGRRVVLVQFYEMPTAQMQSALAKQGLCLQDYLGGRSYFATLIPERIGKIARGGKIRSIVAVRPEWKINPTLSDGILPDYATTETGSLRATLVYHADMNENSVRANLSRLGIKVDHVAPAFRTMTIELPKAQLGELAAEPWVVAINPVAAPAELENYRGRIMSRSHILSQPSELGGRALLGAGVQVGVFDGDVEHHIDFGDRVHIQESEMPVSSNNGHGIHVTGTMAGAGVLDPLARGVAPKATMYTYNFSVMSNRLSVAEKMLQAVQHFNINITQNSYGVAVGKYCKYYDKFSYNGMEPSWETDYITNLHPTLLHVYSVGNDRKQEDNCGHPYGSSTKRSKNALYVGALNADESMSEYSSWGPMDDGRLLPTVVALGTNVYSTRQRNSYDLGTGSSMACPSVSGAAILLTERYRQLNDMTLPLEALLRGAIANTAKDMGATGPDYQYGYGLIDASKAVQTLEQRWYVTNTLRAGAPSATHTIKVPSNVAALKVMLVWTDTVSSKQYRYGEAALINDLDLAVTHGGATTKPWVLNSSKPDAPAVRGEDHVNNMEQVTIDNPTAGDYEVKITPRTISSREQQYVVVYWFEADAPTIIYPLGGEQLAPGDRFYIRWMGLSSPVAAEISYDNGASYSTIATDIAGDKIEYELPHNAPSTAVARIRLTATNGITIKNNIPFSVMGVPQNVRANAIECGGAWAIQWNAVEGAQAYEILKADVGEGTYEVIGTATATDFTIPEDKKSQDMRNVYSVRAKSQSGATGRRAKGVAINASVPLVLTGENIPFVERFAKFPLQFMQIVQGENMEISHISSYPETKVGVGQHLLGSYAKREQGVTDWDADDVFSTKANMNRIRMCSVDLTRTDHQALHLRIRLTQMYYEMQQNSSVRVLINGKIVKDLSGDTVFQAQTPVSYKANTLCFDLTPYLGQTINIEIQHVAKDVACMIVIHEIAIAPPDQQGKIELTHLASTPLVAGESPRNDVRVEVLNNQPNGVKTLALSYRIDDQPPIIESITDLKPYERRQYTFLSRANLSSAEPLGHVFNITGRILYPDTANASARFQSINTGEVLPLGYSPWEIIPFVGLTQNDPKQTVTVQGSLVFTPHRGAYFGYEENQKSTIRFKPSDPAKRIRVLFERFDTEKGADGFYVYNCDVSEDLNLEKVAYTDVLTGTLSNYELLSSAKGGDITFSFASDASISGAGWLAHVTEETPTNIYTLQPLALDPFYASEEASITIRARNNTNTPQTNVRVAFHINDSDDWIEETLPSIDARSEITHTFGTKARLPFGGHYTITARILNQDYDTSDNEVSASMTNDNYCHDLSIKTTAKPYIQEISSADGKSVGCKEGSGRIDYQLASPFTIYSGSAKTQFTVTTNAALESTQTAALYIDWNADGQFDETSERYANYTALPKNQHRFSIDIPTTAAIGRSRMRVMVGKTAELNSACPSNSLSEGDVKDFSIDIKGSPFPINDVEIASIQVSTGNDLTSTEPITITLRNYGATEVTSLELTLIVNGHETTETASVLIPAFNVAECTYTLQQKVDLHNVGRYDIRVKIPDDQNANNNEARTISYSVTPSSTDAFYALKFKKNQTPHEHLDLGDLKGTAMYASNGRRGATFEAWVMPQDPGRNVIFEGKNILIFTITNDKSSAFPNNALVIQFLADPTRPTMTVCTAPMVITPHQWQHIAVALNLKDPKDPNNFKVFINGKQQPVTISNPSFRCYGQENSKMPVVVAPDFGGMVRYIRCWNKQLSNDTLTNTQWMYTSLREASGELPRGLIVEFTTNEGPNNPATLSGKDIATVESARIGDPTDPVWINPSSLISNTQFDEQLLPAEASGPYQLTIPFASSADMSAVKGTIISAWPGTHLEYKNEPITEETVFDFSQPGNSITVIAKIDPAFVFGHTIAAQTFTLVAEKVAASELLSLQAPQVGNPGLTADVNATISKEMLLDVSGVNDMTRVNFIFATSPGATLSVNGIKYNGGTCELDLTHPQRLTVTSSDLRQVSHYMLEAYQNQSITWGNINASYTYGDASQKLLAESTSHLPIIYTSSNNNVATVDGDMLLITGVGETSISATQPGGNGRAAAVPVQQKVVVQPKPINATPKPINIEEQQAIPAIGFTYDGLVKEEHARTIKTPNYTVYVNGKPWDKPKQMLPVGTHTLIPEVSGPYANGNYMVTPKEGTLTVSASNAVKNVGFNVTDAEGHAIEGALVRINQGTYPTNNLGFAQTRLRAGQYPYTVEKENYNPTHGTLTVGSDDCLKLVELQKPAHTLTYSVAEAQLGYILANAQQHVPHRGTGQPVYAIPAQGYIFTRWSDGRTDNPRVDSDIREDITAQAQFDIITFKVSYVASTHGRIEGEAVQTVPYGGTTTSVTAVPDPGYLFIRWSDNFRQEERSDSNPTDDVSYIAIFDEYPTLPYSQNFDGSLDLPNFWSTIDSAQGNHPWFISENVIFDIPPIAGNSAFGYTSNNASLYSPTFSITARETKAITLKFQYNGYQYPATLRALVQYKTDKTDDWTDLPPQLSLTGQVTPFNATIESNDLGDAGKIQFRWSILDGEGGYPFVVDSVNIGIERVIPAAPTTYTLTYTAGAHGTISGETIQTVELGKDGTPVTAIADAGHTFQRWSDGSTENPRTDRAVAKDLTISAEFVKIESTVTTIQEKTLSPLYVYPNPTEGMVCIEAEGIAFVYNNLGRLVHTAPANGKTYIDMRTLPAGIYIIRVGDKAAHVVKR